MNLSAKPFQPVYQGPRWDSGKEGFRTGVIQEKKDTAKEGFGTGGILDCRETGKLGSVLEGCGTGGMLDRRDAGKQEVCRKGERQ